MESVRARSVDYVWALVRSMFLSKKVTSLMWIPNRRMSALSVKFVSRGALGIALPLRRNTKSYIHEQQMLAIARGLMSRPRLLMLDEPSLGLSPILSRKALEICKEVKSRGTTILFVEQKVKDALQLSDWVYVLQSGKVIMEARAMKYSLTK